MRGLVRAAATEGAPLTLLGGVSGAHERSATRFGERPREAAANRFMSGFECSVATLDRDDAG